MLLTTPPFTGTLTAGQFLAPDGAVGAPGYAFASQTDLGLYRRASSSLTIASGGVANVDIVGANITVRSDTGIFWCSSASAIATKDTGFARSAPAVLRPGTQSGGAGGFSFTANTPTALAANTNDYSPGRGLFQRWSATGPVNVTGMVAGVDGEARLLWNVGANTITLTNADVLSAAANRFTTSTGAALALAANKCALAAYDLTSTVWRVTLLP